MHISSVKIKNYKSIKKANIDFSTVFGISGPNSAGKSAIVDAISMVIYSEPFPENCVHFGENNAKVTVRFDTGLEISRVRDGKKQSLVVKHPLANKEEVYTNPLKQKEFVQNLTNFKPVQLDNTNKILLQIMPLGSDQFFMVQGVSDETVLKRFIYLTSGSKLEEARDSIVADIKSEKIKEDGLDIELNTYKSMVNSYDEATLLNDIVTVDNEINQTKQYLEKLLLVESLESNISNIKQIKKLLEQTLPTYTELFTLYRKKEKALQVSEIVSNMAITLTKLQVDEIKYKKHKKILDTYKVCSECNRPL